MLAAKPACSLAPKAADNALAAVLGELKFRERYMTRGHIAQP